jgi:hypothetical protein
MLVERVVVSWVQAWYADCLAAQARGPGATPAALAELERWQEAARPRHLTSLQQLATIRQLVGPAAPAGGAPRLALRLAGVE